jgi:outer membrane protein assembly factor BamB
MAGAPRNPHEAAFVPKPFDWPQWQGQARDDISRETNLLSDWPQDGPPLFWKVQGLGGGYSTPSVMSGRIFGMGAKGENEVVWALTESDGSELWTAVVAPANHRVGYGEGPRCTPTVDNDRIYALGTSGDLSCLETETGKVLWTRSLVNDFGGQIPGWGYCESPLVDGDLVLATPGGKKATIVALDKKSGKTVWQASVSKGNGAAYSSIIAAEVAGQREYIQLLSGGVVGVDAQTGRFLWSYDRPANGTANCSTPIFHEGFVFAASNYGNGGGLAELSGKGNTINATEVYFTKHMKNHHGGMVLVNSCIFGADDSILTCLDFKTGKVFWDSREPGKGSLAYADERLYYRNEGGDMFLIEAQPGKYVRHGRFKQPERSPASAWAHPVIANGKLYLRDQGVLLCYDVKKKL